MEEENNLLFLNSNIANLAENEMLKYVEDSLATINSNHDFCMTESELFEYDIEPIATNQQIAEIYDFLVSSDANYTNNSLNAVDLENVADYLQDFDEINNLPARDEHIVPTKLENIPAYTSSQQNQNQNNIFNPMHAEETQMDHLDNIDDLILTPFKPNGMPMTESLGQFIAQNDIDLNFDWTQFVNFPMDAEDQNKCNDDEIATSSTSSAISIECDEISIDNKVQLHTAEKLRSEIEQTFAVSKYYEDIEKELETSKMSSNYCYKLSVCAGESEVNLKGTASRYSLFLMPSQSADTNTDKAEYDMQLSNFARKIGENPSLLNSFLDGIIKTPKKKLTSLFTPKQSVQKIVPVSKIEEELAKIDKENIIIPEIRHDGVKRTRKQLFEIEQPLIVQNENNTVSLVEKNKKSTPKIVKSAKKKRSYRKTVPQTEDATKPSFEIYHDDEISCDTKTEMQDSGIQEHLPIKDEKPAILSNQDNLPEMDLNEIIPNAKKSRVPPAIGNADCPRSSIRIKLKQQNKK